MTFGGKLDYLIKQQDIEYDCYDIGMQFRHLLKLSEKLFNFSQIDEISNYFCLSVSLGCFEFMDENASLQQ